MSRTDFGREGKISFVRQTYILLIAEKGNLLLFQSRRLHLSNIHTQIDSLQYGDSLDFRFIRCRWSKIQSAAQTFQFRIGVPVPVFHCNNSCSAKNTSAHSAKSFWSK